MGIQGQRRRRIQETSSLSVSSTPGVHESDNVIARIHVVLDSLSAMVGDRHPMARVMKRTVRDLLIEMGEQVQDGKISEQVIREKMDEFARTLEWVSHAPNSMVPQKLELVQGDQA